MTDWNMAKAFDCDNVFGHFLLFASDTALAVKKQCRKRIVAERRQTFASLCLVAARYVSLKESA